MPHSIWRHAADDVRLEKKYGSTSADCVSSDAQSMVVPSRRAGVPVFKRPSTKPSRSRVSDKPFDGASPSRPAEMRTSPIWIRPRKNVPVVRTAAPHAICRPPFKVTALTRPSAGQNVVQLHLREFPDFPARPTRPEHIGDRACGLPGFGGLERPSPSGD